MKPQRVIFFGTPEYTVPFLEVLNNEYTVVGVVTAPDRKVGRKQLVQSSPIKEAALREQLPIFTPEKIKGNEEFLDAIKSLKPDICVLFAYGKILPQELLDIPEFGFVNVHPSKLPEYRGPSPIQAAIIDGKTESAISIMKLVAEMDAGPTYLQKEFPISNTDTAVDIFRHISDEGIGPSLVVDVLDTIFYGKYTLTEQDHSQATYCSMISREDGKIDFNKDSVELIARKGRAYFPWPGLYYEVNTFRLKIVLPKPILTVDLPDLPLGGLFLTQDSKCAIVGKDGYLIPERLQFAGKKELSNTDFVNGNKQLFEI